jgi:hypothetical protein
MSIKPFLQCKRRESMRQVTVAWTYVTSADSRHGGLCGVSQEVSSVLAATSCKKRTVQWHYSETLMDKTFDIKILSGY